MINNQTDKVIANKSVVADAMKSVATRTITMDNFTNSLSRMGFGQPNVSNGSFDVMVRLTRSYQQLNTLYRNNWIVRRIVDTVAKDMIKQWVSLKTDLTPEEIGKFDREVRYTRTKKSLLEAAKWGRLYGGAAAIPMIEGQEDLEQPLDVEGILPGQYKGLLVLDRWSGIYPQLELVDDISDKDYGLPKYYIIKEEASSTNTVRVHHSRVLRFTGHSLPLWETLAEAHWGSSVLESVYEELKKRNNTSANIANLVFLANLRVLKMDDLGGVLASVNEASQKVLYNTLSAQNMLMSNMGVYVMDKDDEFQSFQYSFSGMPEVYELFMLDVAGASEIPATKLYGRSPQGMNSTGEGEESNYVDLIKQNQEESLRENLDKLFAIIMKSAIGYIPDDLDFDFNTIEIPSQKEIADQVWRTSEAITGAYREGIISQKIALKELRQSGAPLNMYTNITNEDISRANDDLSSGQPVDNPFDDLDDINNENPDERMEDKE